MWKKLIFAVVLVAFVGVRFASSLTCYSCNDATSCKNPTVQTCSNATANATSDWLSTYHNDVPEVGGSQSFLCANLTYYTGPEIPPTTPLGPNNTLTSEFLGCAHPDIRICARNLTDPDARANWKSHCGVCYTDNCNYDGPAGTFSGSAYTIIGSISALLLTKVLS
ncbi:GL11397 [Drosophila persimilis]|uniref:GL11397 n=1 Tax=Drosophila persimilis TaxID=7234 RepID=B4GAK1_DROPE|nr:uncharacterized protein LOC6590207 [Drosophila persimilis]EDW31953.1 GL11397 [Drosophila persimilis]